MGDDYDHWTWTIDQEKEHYDYVEQKVKDYGIEEYLLSHEEITRKGDRKPHFHGIVYTSKKNVTNLVKHFVDRYKLRNTSGRRGGSRHYTLGKKPVYDIDHFRVYCCKDGNVRSNMTEAQIEQYILKSYKKDERMKLYEDVHKHLTALYLPELYTGLFNTETSAHIRQYRENVINYMVKNTDSINITKGQIDNMVKYHLFQKARETQEAQYEHELYALLYRYD